MGMESSRSKAGAPPILPVMPSPFGRILACLRFLPTGGGGLGARLRLSPWSRRPALWMARRRRRADECLRVRRTATPAAVHRAVEAGTLKISSKRFTAIRSGSHEIHGNRICPPATVVAVKRPSARYALWQRRARSSPESPSRWPPARVGSPPSRWPSLPAPLTPPVRVSLG